MVNSYDQLKGIHSLMAILTDAAKYEAGHGNAKFVRPCRPPLYNKNIPDNATTVVRVGAEAAHKSRLDDYVSYEAAKRGVAKSLRNVFDEIWCNNLKDAETFYTQVTAINIMALLDANSGELHAVDMISLRTNMTQYYAEADGIPQFIVMMEDAQKKAKWANMSIANVELVMMASAAVLAAQHFPLKVDDWEGLPAIDRTWRAWQVAFHLAHIKRQHQLQASGGDEPLRGAHSVLPTPAATMDRLGTALDNLALVAANDTTVLQLTHCLSRPSHHHQETETCFCFREETETCFGFREETETNMSFRCQATPTYTPAPRSHVYPASPSR
jgi:tRNA(Leu) C34 or U34 (ribose-2'-O)-methylase TrmL